MIQFSLINRYLMTDGIRLRLQVIQVSALIIGLDLYIIKMPA